MNLVEESDDLACDVFSPRLLVIHDTGRSGEHDVAELTGWQKLDDPLLHVDELDVVAGADHAGFVDAGESSVQRSKRKSQMMMCLPAVELNDDLAIAMIIDLLELADVACAK